MESESESESEWESETKTDVFDGPKKCGYFRGPEMFENIIVETNSF